MATGWPVLMALSNKDFVGETLDCRLDQRLEGTLAATAIAAWQGAAVFRAHQVAATRRVVEMAASIRGTRARRGAPRRWSESSAAVAPRRGRTRAVGDGAAVADRATGVADRSPTVALSVAAVARSSR